MKAAKRQQTKQGSCRYGPHKAVSPRPAVLQAYVVPGSGPPMVSTRPAIRIPVVHPTPFASWSLATCLRLPRLSRAASLSRLQVSDSKIRATELGFGRNQSLALIQQSSRGFCLELSAPRKGDARRRGAASHKAAINFQTGCVQGWWGLLISLAP